MKLFFLTVPSKTETEFNKKRLCDFNGSFTFQKQKQYFGKIVHLLKFLFQGSLQENMEHVTLS